MKTVVVEEHRARFFLYLMRLTTTVNEEIAQKLQSFGQQKRICVSSEQPQDTHIDNVSPEAPGRWLFWDSYTSTLYSGPHTKWWLPLFLFSLYYLINRFHFTLYFTLFHLIWFHFILIPFILFLFFSFILFCFIYFYLIRIFKILLSFFHLI